MRGAKAVVAGIRRPRPARPACHGQGSLGVWSAKPAQNVTATTTVHRRLPKSADRSPIGESIGYIAMTKRKRLTADVVTLMMAVVSISSNRGSRLNAHPHPGGRSVVPSGGVHDTHQSGVTCGRAGAESAT